MVVYSKFSEFVISAKWNLFVNIILFNVYKKIKNKMSFFTFVPSKSNLISDVKTMLNLEHWHYVCSFLSFYIQSYKTVLYKILWY